MKTLGLITARGGSKGIPRKNIRLLGGRPLIAWTIEAAHRSGMLDGVVVSTDDDEIAAVSRAEGAGVPFMRSADLARDDTPTLTAVLDALDRLPDFDAVLLLQPTSPFRSPEDIRGCLLLARDRQSPSVVSVSESANHPYWTYRLDNAGHLAPFVESGGATRRQDLPAAYALNGALYYAEANWLRRSGGFIGDETLAYRMPAGRSVDIDSELDWQMAETVLGSATWPAES